MQTIKQRITDSIRVKEKLLEDDGILKTAVGASKEIIDALRNGHTIFFCGNGGSAADAQHLAAELSGRFYFDRKPLPAEALHTNSSALTAISNDYSFEEAYSRIMTARARPGDVLVAISTSGNSPNIIHTIKTANELGVATIGMSGKTGGKMAGICKYIFKIPSEDTARIQECHILLGHILCELAEKELCKT